jgi:hypothetical protein
MIAYEVLLRKDAAGARYVLDTTEEGWHPSSAGILQVVPRSMTKHSCNRRRVR